MPDLDDAARRAAKGDARAFRALVEGTSARLYRLALRMTTDADDARDVLQDAYVRAHRALLAGEFKGEARIETWLYRVVVNAALNHQRGQARQRRLEDPVRTAPTSPEVNADLARVMALVRDLPPEQRAALVLKELEGHTSAEIGKMLGCSEGAVEQRLMRAREALRKRLSDA